MRIRLEVDLVHNNSTCELQLAPMPAGVHRGKKTLGPNPSGGDTPSVLLSLATVVCHRDVDMTHLYDAESQPPFALPGNVHELNPLGGAE